MNGPLELKNLLPMKERCHHQCNICNKRVTFLKYLLKFDDKEKDIKLDLLFDPLA